MIAVPGEPAVTTPVAPFTVATKLFDENHVTVSGAPPTTCTLAVSDTCALGGSCALGVFVVTDCTAGATFTVIAADPDFVASKADVAEIDAVPAATAVTRPAPLTVATLGLLDDQFTVVGAPPLCTTFAVSCCVCPTSSDGVAGVTPTLVIAAPLALNVTSPGSVTTVPSRFAWMVASRRADVTLSVFAPAACDSTHDGHSYVPSLLGNSVAGALASTALPTNRPPPVPLVT